MFKSGVTTKAAIAVGAFLAIGAAGEARAEVFGICWSNTGPVPGDRPVRSRVFQVPQAVSPDIAVPQMKSAVAAFVGPDVRVGFTNCLYKPTRVEADIEELQFQKWNAENEVKHPDITEPVRYIDFMPIAAPPPPPPPAPPAPPPAPPPPAAPAAVAAPVPPPAPEVAPSTGGDADLNREVTERNAEVQKRNDAAKAAFEQQQRAYLDALTRQQAEAERLKREDAEARKRYEAEMAAWRARVEACKSGDASQCN